MDTNKSANESTAFDELSKSVGQICTQFSFANLQVPRIDTFNDVHNFLAEFELATIHLTDEQRLNVLPKSFPPGRYSAWYKKTLASYKEADKTVDWKSFKKDIIKRYSASETRDRHLLRLKELKFNDDGTSKLYDFVEDILYSFSYAFPTVKDDDSQIRYVKANLPATLGPVLGQIHNFNSAKTMDDFMQGIKQFDLIRFNSKSSPANSSPKVDTSEVVKLIRELVNEVKQTQEVTKTVVAAINPYSRDQSPGRAQQQRSSDRGRSPARNYPTQGNFQQTNYANSRFREHSPGRNFSGDNRGYNSNFANSRDRYQSPTRNFAHSNQQTRQFGYQGRSPEPTRRNPQFMISDRSANRVQSIAFDEEAYYNKFGMPPSACQNCNLMHWTRHCHNHLN